MIDKMVIWMNRTCRISEQDMLISALEYYVEPCDISVYREGRIKICNIRESDLIGIMKVLIEWRDVIRSYYVPDSHGTGWKTSGEDYAPIEDLYPYWDTNPKSCVRRLKSFTLYDNMYSSVQHCHCGCLSVPDVEEIDGKFRMVCSKCGEHIEGDKLDMSLIKKWNEAVVKNGDS